MNSRQSFIAKFYPQKIIQSISKKIKLLGISYPYQAIDLLNIRIFTCLFLFCTIILFLPFGYVLAPIITIMIYFIIEYLTLDKPIQKRKNRLEEEAIFFFEVLNLNFDAKKNLLVSLEQTTSLIEGELSDEFKKTLSETRLGKNIYESLKNMRERIPSSTINQVLLNLMEKENHGNQIGQTISQQVEYLREKKLQKTKAAISKLPVKISLISSLFLIPFITLMILAPIILDYYLP